MRLIKFYAHGLGVHSIHNISAKYASGFFSVNAISKREKKVYMAKDSFFPSAGNVLLVGSSCWQESVARGLDDSIRAAVLDSQGCICSVHLSPGRGYY